jgi:hypothetical protein
MPKSSAKAAREATQYPVNHNLTSDKKEFTISGGCNRHGRFVRVQEMIRGRKNFVFIPPQHVEEFCRLLIQTKNEIMEYSPAVSVSPGTPEE